MHILCAEWCAWSNTESQRIFRQFIKPFHLTILNVSYCACEKPFVVLSTTVLWSNNKPEYRIGTPLVCIYIYIYMYVCVCVCVYIYISGWRLRRKGWFCNAIQLSEMAVMLTSHRFRQWHIATRNFSLNSAIQYRLRFRGENQKQMYSF